MTEHNHVGQYYSNIDWTHHQLMYTFVTRHRIVKAFNQLQPPFPRTGASSAILRSLINPPTMFFFGGSSIQNQHNDLYRFTFDPNDSKPSLTAGIVNTRGQAPAPRSHAILSATDGHLFLWGGQTNSNVLDHHLYRLSLSTNYWNHYIISGPSPALLFGSSSTIFEGFLYVYAGHDVNRSVQGDMWRIELDSLPSVPSWELISSSKDQICPPARTSHSAVVSSNSWIIFGGTDGVDVFNDLWEYRFREKKWRQVSANGSVPPPRKDHLVTQVKDHMYVFGGHDVSDHKIFDFFALDLINHVWHRLSSNGLEQVDPCGNISAWNQQLQQQNYISTSAMESLSSVEDYPTNEPPPGKRIRPQKQAKRWDRAREKREQPVCTPGQHQNIYHHSVPPSRQHDPCPTELVTSQRTIKEQYVSISHGVCIVAPNDLPPFCMAAWYPFETMAANEKKGWEQFVLHLLSRIDYVAQVNTNGPQQDGTMWADGWRKCSKNTEHFGRFCCVESLRKQMKLLNFDPDDQKARLLQAGEWISSHLKDFAPVVHDNYHQLLTINQYPSMNHTEYGQPYTTSDFASFLTFTMFDFHNLPHNDNDVNDWTLVGWIPIFNPKKSDNPQILADQDFDMIGGQFSFRDFQICLDLTKTLGVTLCVFRSKDFRHQTLPGASPSGKYTRIGFSCQINQSMASAVTAYLQGNYEKKLNIGGLQNQVDNANAPKKKKKT
ncbi:Leucine-zipper-like transcriptional regulator 1 [Puccinia graminis f. sp. tritici]|uniref:Leucine-zipper-like transcriptional regulator 1 n=1 Tax=Puccinia graminis f. sp. tritici TaxID=56615 RepID=A0A5B0P7H0_PUCGR|nr:Leucine-zipper-like transcriptional regulator 1 [Puccinia graminis f. sp. tritici]